MSIQLIISVVSTGLAIASLGYAGYEWIKLRQDTQRLSAESLLENALNSSDIHVLRNYLFDELGGIAISEYANQTELRKRVDAYIERVVEFTAVPELDVETEPELFDIQFDTGHGDSPSINTEIAKIDSAIYTGEVWNGLARLRRNIEILLREKAIKREVDIPLNISAGPMTRLLLNNEVIGKPMYMDLQFILNVCNEAIHGHEVKHKDVEKALSLAKPILEKLAVA